MHSAIHTEVTSGSAVTICFSAGKYLFCLNSISPGIERNLCYKHYVLVKKIKNIMAATIKHSGNNKPSHFA